MLSKLTVGTLLYVVLFLLFCLVGMSGVAYYRGTVIADLQVKLAARDEKNFKIVIDNQHIADEVGKRINKSIEELRAEKETNTHEIRTIVQYRDNPNCFDAERLQLANKAADTANTASRAASEPASAVQGGKEAD